MSTEDVSSAVGPLVAELFDTTAPRRGASLLGWGFALGAHVLAAGLALGDHRAPVKDRPLEVELAVPEPPPPPVAPPPPPEARPIEAMPVAKAAAAAPEPARAAALVTAKADPIPAAAADEPVDFTNDPSALGFGSGVVAIGGKAQLGLNGALPSTAPAASGTGGRALGPVGDALTPASDLSKKPGLGESDPCRGYFPSGASDDVATAAVMVTIGKSGAVASVQLLSESPLRQGFGAAARTCMTHKRFSPGLDRDGRPTATAIRVNIRFSR